MEPRVEVMEGGGGGTCVRAEQLVIVLDGTVVDVEAVVLVLEVKGGEEELHDGVFHRRREEKLAVEVGGVATLAVGEGAL